MKDELNPYASPQEQSAATNAATGLLQHRVPLQTPIALHGTPCADDYILALRTIGLSRVVGEALKPNLIALVPLCLGIVFVAVVSKIFAFLWALLLAPLLAFTSHFLMGMMSMLAAFVAVRAVRKNSRPQNVPPAAQPFGEN